MVDVDSWQTQLAFYGYLNEPYTNDVYENSLPRLIDLFQKFSIKGTFFIVGKHAKVEKNKLLLRRISDFGGEIASHSMTHPRGFSSIGYEKKCTEIKESKAILEDAIGKEVKGFRAPDYDIDEETIDILVKEGYRYDSSVFPTYLAPLMKLTHFLLSGTNKKTTMGREKLRFAPTVPYRPDGKRLQKKGEANILEIPLSVMPYLRLPFYGTSVMAFGERYLNFVFNKLKKSSFVNYTIHAFELSDKEKDKIDKRLLKHPGVKKSYKEKIDLCEKVLGKIKENFNIMTASEYTEGVK